MIRGGSGGGGGGGGNGNGEPGGETSIISCLSFSIDFLFILMSVGLSRIGDGGATRGNLGIGGGNGGP